MLKKIGQILLAALLGYIFGSIVGILFGIMFGIGLGLFFQEIVYSGQTVIMSLLFGAGLGGLLGFLAILALQKLYGVPYTPMQGAGFGVVLGVLVVVSYGFILTFNPPLDFHTLPAAYGVAIGQYIGSIQCTLIGVLAVVQSFSSNRLSNAEQQRFATAGDFYKKRLAPTPPPEGQNH